MTGRSRTVVFVHGLWMTGHESIFLRRELRRELDAECAVFSYRSVVEDVTANAAALAQFLRGFDAPRLDLVGHSLGGLVILKCLEDHPLAVPGRVVLLGSPLQGSAVARALSRFPLLKAMLGRGIEQEAVPEVVRRWHGQREVGVIAGSLSLGMGRLFAPLPEPNDGTVTVAETQLDGAADHVVLPVSHTGMWMSPEVAGQVANFLERGGFDQTERSR
jgi:pimeloyl-ACP methyl ester carboxylesterase